MNFATPETIKQPKGNLILEDLTETDYILGSKDPKNIGKVVVEDGHWARFAPIPELQKILDARGVSTGR